MNDSIEMHNLLWFLLVGGLAGWMASVLVTGSGLGILADIVVGIVGAFVGGLLANFFHWYFYGFWEVLGVSIVGAVILLVVFRGFAGKRG